MGPGERLTPARGQGVENNLGPFHSRNCVVGSADKFTNQPVKFQTLSPLVVAVITYPSIPDADGPTFFLKFL
jgi:hypothetical protein